MMCRKSGQTSTSKNKNWCALPGRANHRDHREHRVFQLQKERGRLARTGRVLNQAHADGTSCEKIKATRMITICTAGLWPAPRRASAGETPAVQIANKNHPIFSQLRTPALQIAKQPGNTKMSHHQCSRSFQETFDVLYSFCGSGARRWFL